MSKKDKKCQCENKEELNEECTCQQNECCNDDCCCNEDTCCCGEGCECSNQDINTNELLSNRIKELNEVVLRSQAELLNYKKRKDEETARILKYAEKDILEGFLPILDNFERAINMDDNNLEDEVSKFLQGFKMIYCNLVNTLEKFEVKAIDGANKEFDPTYHQGVSTAKDDTKESGIILEVFQKGYIYKDKVIRPSMVKVNE